MQIRSIGILGYGDFGQFLHSLAREHVPEIPVRVFSSRKEPDGSQFFSLADTCATDLLILCVPISAFAETIDRVLPHLAQNTIVCDVATVKKHTVSVLKEKAVPRYLATHPMFGPYSYAKQGRALSGLRIVVCESSLAQDEMREVLGFLTQAQLKVLQLSADEHDRMVAETLFLTHLVGQTVKRGGFERTSVDTISFGFLMDAVESVSNDDVLFRDVYRFNEYCADVIARFEQAEKWIHTSLKYVSDLGPAA